MKPGTEGEYLQRGLGKKKNWGTQKSRVSNTEPKDENPSAELL